MTPSFRLIYFSPDPFVGSRVPVGALVTGHDHSFGVVAEMPPSPRCLGGEGAASLVGAMLEELVDAREVHELPPAFGPQFTLGPRRAAPDGVADVPRWVREAVLPRKGERDATFKARRPERRDAVGMGLFKKGGVGNYVRKRLRPRNLGLMEEDIDAVTHWVDGDRRILALEPFSLSAHDFAARLRATNTLVHAWRNLAQRVQERVQVEIVPYLLPGHLERAAEALEHLRPVADRVIDTNLEQSRRELFTWVRDIGETRDAARAR